MAQLSFSDFEKNLQRKKSRKAEFLEALKMSNLVDTFLTRLRFIPHSLLRHSTFVF